MMEFVSPLTWQNSNSIKFIDELDKVCVYHSLTPSIIKDSRLKLDTIKKCYGIYYLKNIYEYIKHGL